MLQAFDRLFAKTANKLQISYTGEELAEAKERFAEKMQKVFDIFETTPFEPMTPGAVEEMESAIDELSPSQVVAQLATLPLVQQVQMALQRLAYRAAEQKMIEHALDQVDTTYGGN